MEAAKTVKREVKKPTEEKFLPPVAEVVESESVAVQPVVTKVAAVTSTPVIPESKPTQIKWGLFYAGLLVVVLVIGFSGGLWWAYRTRVGMTTVEPSPSPLVQTTPEPTVIPVVVDRAAIAVDVLNASGVRGKAGEVATQIQAFGYAKGKTGNATDQQASTISLTSDVASWSGVIVEDVRKVVPSASLSGELSSGTLQIRVVLGSE